VRLKFKLKLSPAWVDQHIVEHGTRPADEYEIEFDLTKVGSAPLRKRLLIVHRRYEASRYLAVMPVPTSDPEELVATLEPWLDRHAPEPSTFADAMATWIAERGSPRLRLAHERGYKVNATYARERAAVEFSSYWVDTNGSALVNDRTDPSADALAVETDARGRAQASPHDGLVPRIVWMIRPPDDLAQSLGSQGKAFNATEAIHIANYLNRYSLYLPLPYPRDGGS
jgi:hypothetical protein